MATRTIANGGGNWNSTGTWVEGAVPTSADNVVATATSGNLTINATAASLSVDFTNYVGTLSLSGGVTWTVSGNFKMVAGMTVSGTATTLSITAVSILTSNGKIWTGALSLVSGVVITLADPFTVNGLFTCGNAGGAINSSQLNVNGNLTLSTGLFGSSILNFGGTTTVIGAAAIIMPLTINTSGTVTFNNSPFTFQGSSITYTAGTVVSSGTTLVIDAVCTISTNGMTWNTVQLNPGWGLTFGNDFNVLNLTTPVASFNQTLTGSNINVSGNWTCSGALTMSGTTNFKLTGTATFTPSTVIIQNNLTFVSGTRTISGTILNYNTGTITYTAGTVNTGTCVLTITASTSATLNISGMTWNSVTFQNASTITLSSDLNIGTTLQLNSGISNTITINGNNANISGTLSISSGAGTIAGTTTFRFVGTTTTLLVAGGTTQNNITFVSGTVTFSGANFAYNTGTITYSGGTVNTGTTNLNVASSTTFNTNGMTWNSITFTGASATITLNSALSVTTLTEQMVGGTPWTVTFAGTSGFTVGTLLFSQSSGRILTLKSGITYTITTALTSTVSTSAGHNIINCSTVNGTKAIFTLQQGATQDLSFVDGTDLDSTAGKTIWSYKGTLTRALNWQVLPTQPKNIATIS